LVRLEFYGDAKLSFDVIAFIVLSSILACVAMLSRSVPVLIGAMVLAPVFDPLVAIPFGIRNRDTALIKQGLLSSLGLFAAAFATCYTTVWLLLLADVVPPSLTDIGPDMVTERLTLGPHSVLTALVAGAGGALAAAANRRENLIGVVQALALIPAIAASAIATHYPGPDPLGGLALFFVNVVGVIVAGAAVLFLRRGAGRVRDEVEDKEGGDL